MRSTSIIFLLIDNIFLDSVKLNYSVSTKKLISVMAVWIPSLDRFWQFHIFSFLFYDLFENTLYIKYSTECFIRISNTANLSQFLF